MERLIEFVLRVYDKVKREPVRARLYTLGLAVLSALAVLGYIDPEQAEQWGAALAYVLVVESTRRKVKPMQKVVDGDHVDPLR